MLFLLSMLGIVSAYEINVGNDNKTLVVGFNSQFPPFGYKGDNGEFTGFDIDLAKEVCKRNNWTLRLEPLINWDTKDTELNSGMMDCIWSEFTINGRENDYTWSKPYFNTTQVVVVKNNSNISKLEDLKGKYVEVQEGQSALKNLENDNKTFADGFRGLIKIKDYNSGFMDLDAGSCDAIIVDETLAKYQIKEKHHDLKILDEPLSHEQYGVAFKKGNVNLKNQVQKTLDEMYSDGTINKIAQKYKDYGVVDGLIS